MTILLSHMTKNLIGQRILALAAARGIKRSELAELSGVSPDRLKNLLRRPGAKPNREDLKGFAAALETTEEYILNGGEVPAPNEALLAQVQDRLRELSEEELRMLAVGLRRPSAQGSPADGE